MNRCTHVTVNQPSESSPKVLSLVFAKGLSEAWAALGIIILKKGFTKNFLIKKDRFNLRFFDSWWDWRHIFHICKSSVRCPSSLLKTGASELPGSLVVKDLVLSLLWPGLLLWCRFDPWSPELLHAAGEADKQRGSPWFSYRWISAFCGGGACPEEGPEFRSELQLPPTPQLWQCGSLTCCASTFLVFRS